MKKLGIVGFGLLSGCVLHAQQHWHQVDSLFGSLPSGVHVFKSTDSLDGKPSIAYYLEAPLKDKHLAFTTDTVDRRRITPDQFFEKEHHPLLIVNCSFFSFETNKSINLLVSGGHITSFATPTIPGRGKDTLTYRHPLGSALGISRHRQADIGWTYSDSTQEVAYISQQPIHPIKDSNKNISLLYFKQQRPSLVLKKWKMQTIVGGGPVLVQGDTIQISNNEEIRFPGKDIQDKHPRTAMGYTADGRLVVLAIEGRHPGIAEGATLVQEARLLRDIGCREALNLDGGGSSCMLVNGRQTITPSEKGIQRPLPAVFIIRQLSASGKVTESK